MILTLENMREKILEECKDKDSYKNSIKVMIDNGIWIDEVFYEIQKDKYGDIDVSSVINCENLDCFGCLIGVSELNCSIDRVDISGEISFEEFEEYYLKTLQLALQKMFNKKNEKQRKQTKG